MLVMLMEVMQGKLTDHDWDKYGRDDKYDELIMSLMV